MAEGLVVGRLRGGEARTIDAVVHVLVDEGVDAIDLGAQRSRVIVFLRVRELVERGIEHADDLGGLVVDDRLLLLVPQHRHGDAAGEMGIGHQIDLAQPFLAVDEVGDRRRRLGEAPAAFQHYRINDGNRDHLFHLFQPAEDERAMRPRAGERHIEVIAAARGFETAFAGRPGRAVGRDPVVEAGRLALEAAAGARVVAALLPDAVNEHSHFASFPSPPCGDAAPRREVLPRLDRPACAWYAARAFARALPVSDISPTIAVERPGDQPAIEKLYERTFGPGRFARSAYRLREKNAHRRELSFTARVGTLLVVSVRLTPVRIGTTPALLLGPLTVEPPFRGHGIGSKLITASLAAAEKAGTRLVLLV